MRWLYGLIFLIIPGQCLARPWVIAPQSTITADVTWQGLNVPVHFPSFAGNIDFDERKIQDTRAAIAVATVDATTGLPSADALLRGPGYLDSKSFPRITFRLDKLTQTSKSTADVQGMITLRGVSAPLLFHATVFRYGPAPDNPARFEAGFDLSGKIDRTMFGSTGGLPALGAVMPIRIHLLIRSQ